MGHIQRQRTYSDMTVTLIDVATNQGADPRQQLIQRERFDQIVVRACVESGNAFADGVACGQDQHRRHLLLPPQAYQKMQSIFIRQAKIQHHQTIQAAGEMRFSIPHARDAITDIAFTFQRQHQTLQQQGVIFNNQYLH